MKNLLATPEINFQPPEFGSQRPMPYAESTQRVTGAFDVSADSRDIVSSDAEGSRPKLVGIARMAEKSAKLRARTGVQYFALPAHTALNRESSGRMPFAWTLNPYRGCEFGCKYCYARYTHEFLELRDGRDFERKIFAKLGSPDILRAELRQARDRGLPIALGTATDPYQPAEKQFQITRRMLEVFREFEGIDFSITTKSTLVLRDLDLLRPIAQQHHLSVHITVTTVDARLARRIEPKAPPPLKRLEAVKALVDAGIRAGVNAAPVLPGLSDSPSQLERLARAAAEHHARFFFVNVLFLMPSAKAQFMPFLEKEYPHLAWRYRRLYQNSAYLSKQYKDDIEKLTGELRERYGLAGSREEHPLARHYEQLALGL
jgi:DNA repair photolyase